MIKGSNSFGSANLIWLIMIFEVILRHSDVPLAQSKHVWFNGPLCPHRTDGGSCPRRTRCPRQSLLPPLHPRPGAPPSGAMATSVDLRRRRAETTGRMAGEPRQPTARTRSRTAAWPSQSTRTQFLRRMTPKSLNFVSQGFEKWRRVSVVSFVSEAANDAEQTVSLSRCRQRRARAKAGRTTRRGRGRGENDVKSRPWLSVTCQLRSQEQQRW